MPASQRHPQELDALVEITEILTGPLPFLEKCESTLTVLAKFTGSDLVTLREFDSESATLELIASYNSMVAPEDADVLQTVNTLAAKGLVLHTPVVVNDYSALETRDDRFYELGVRSALTLPVQIDGEVVGTLGFASKSLGHYQEDTVGVLVAISSVVGMMIAKAELQESNQVEANIGRIVSAPLVGPDVFERFAAEAAKIISFDRLALNSVDLQEYTFVTEFLFGVALPDNFVRATQDIDGTGLELAVRSRAGQMIDFNTRNGDEPIFRFMEAFVAAGQPYLISVPLIVGDQVIGTLGFNRGARRFSQKDLAKAERLASLVAGAFADFKQQEFRVQAEREIAKNRVILEAEAKIGRILSSPSSRAAIGALTSEIASIIPLDRVVIAAIDLETETFTTEFNEFLSDSKLIVSKFQGKPYAGSITGEVIKHRQGQIINSGDPRLVSGQLPLVEGIIGLGYRSIMAVPLVYEGRIIGTMITLSKSEATYGEEEMVTAVRIGKSLAGALATFKIANERDRALSDLSESESRFRQIADSIGGVFWLVDLDPHRLIYASPNAEAVWDTPLDDIYRDFGEIFKNIHPEDLLTIQQDSVGADNTGELDIEYRIIKRDGSVRWIQSRGFPVTDSDGKVYRMSGIAEDVTDRKLDLERITEASRLLSVGELASGVAHEINNPLAAINLYTESLMGQALPDSVIQDLKIISAQSHRAATIVRNLLQFARKSSPEITTVQAREFIDRCMELKIHDFRINNISASTSVFLEHPEISIDEQLMTQVIVNILSNAEQACVEAHGRGHISISVHETDSSTQINISDDGPGIPAENLLKVFDPFFTTKEVGGGTGLGLSVSYGIIAQLGGKLWAESDGKSGATFHIEVPRAATGQPSDQLAKRPEQEHGDDDAGYGTDSSLSVLVVDDEPDLRHVLVRLLQRQRHEVEEAADGEEAWAKLQERRYDCILLDLRMAGMGGRELFQRIHSSDPGMAAKVIFLTGDLANTDTLAFLSPLTNRVLEKPVSIGELVEAIDSVTGSGGN